MVKIIAAHFVKPNRNDRTDRQPETVDNPGIHGSVKVSKGYDDRRRP